ncbi:uncharacterized protein EI90DRAFT_1302507 [Cantharellus anzutake]|uniref:uncharacterized protein n=1 Tax=Cantharellus anzutake TaxID=1750568 RepID=UPI001905022C|nr:uncharacterized protein EI90DRAFT_1302507 [Cantharellus anzutake]KAF8342101.1 hypothetical protein EI90DRAFT_1302507 [Cantharellus anzutake]
MASLLQWASLPLRMPDERPIYLLKDWRDFKKSKPVAERQRSVKQFILRAADLRAWAVWAMFQFIDTLAAAHGLSPPRFHVDHQQSGCTIYMSNMAPDETYQLGEQLEQMIRHGTPVYIVESCPLPPNTSTHRMAESLCVAFEPASQCMSVHAYYRVLHRDIHHPEGLISGLERSEPPHPILVAISRISELMGRQFELGAQSRTAILAVIHDLFPESFEFFANANPEPEANDEECGPIVCRVSREEIEDVLDFGGRFQAALPPPEHVYENLPGGIECYE